MKKVLTLVVVATLLTSPALAYAGPNDPVKPKVDLTAAAKLAAKDIVLSDASAAPLEEGAPPPQGGVAKGKLWAGIGMIGLGAALIWKGSDVYQSEPDPFGRKKNADAYLAFGVGSVIAAFGVLTVRGGLAGRGFNE